MAKVAVVSDSAVALHRHGKRKRQEDTVEGDKIKRPRSSSLGTDSGQLSRLSDELVLRIFSHLPLEDLNVCQRLSRKYCAIATDSQLWKIAYYHRFVRPHSSRTLRWREHFASSTSLSRWMRQLGSTALANVSDWKWQYRLRHNWSRGQCSKSEIKVDDERPLPPLHICMHDGIVFTADAAGGLRAWSVKGDRKMQSKTDFICQQPPSALAVDKSSTGEGRISLTVGFRDGSFSMYMYDKVSLAFVEMHAHPASSNGLLVAIAYCSPFLVTMTAGQLLSVYRLKRIDELLEPPILLHSLRSQTIWPPLAVSLRTVAQSHVVAIAYVIPTVMNWNVGIQELYIDGNGKIRQSRTATSAYAGGRLGSRTVAHSHALGLSAIDFSAAAPAFSKPSSISYSHPYLLLSHPDNTLTLFLVNSSLDELSISSATRLWGHTSSVSGAHIEDRGKAVSVSAKGEELRIWELEGSLGRRWLLNGNWSIRVNPAPTTSPKPIEEDGIMRNWVAFDDDSVVVLKERAIGRTDLIVYDFT